jgi:hypothetical protein
MTTNRILQQLLFLRRHFIEKVECMQSTSLLLYCTVYAIILDTLQCTYSTIQIYTVIQTKDECDWCTNFFAYRGILRCFKLINLYSTLIDPRFQHRTID